MLFFLLLLYMVSYANSNIKGYNLSKYEADFRHYLHAVIALRPNSVKNYISDFKHFSGWLELYIASSLPDRKKHAKLNFIDTSIVREYKSYLISNTLPRRTVNRRLSTLRKFFSFALNLKWIDVNPTKGVKNVPMSKIVYSETISHKLDKYKSSLTNNNKAKSYVIHSVHDLEEFLGIIN